MLPPYWVGESRVSAVTAFGIQMLPDACNPVNKVDVSVDTGNGLYFGMRPCRLENMAQHHDIFSCKALRSLCRVHPLQASKV